MRVAIAFPDPCRSFCRSLTAGQVGTGPPWLLLPAGRTYKPRGQARPVRLEPGCGADRRNTLESSISGQTLRVMSSLAVRAAFDASIVPAFEAKTGCKVAVDWTPTTMIMQRVAAGERVDVLVAVDGSMDGLVEQNQVDAASRAAIVESRLGLAVRAGAPHPDMSTLESFKRALVEARSVAYSHAGASGIHLETVLE